MDLEDFRKEDGRIDWEAYKKYEISIGGRCYQCDDLILNFGGPHRQLCHPCKRIDKDPGDVRHDKLIRCPKCKHLFNPMQDCDDYYIYDDANKEQPSNVHCHRCEHEFEIKCIVSYSFESPPLDPDEEEVEEDEV